MAEKITRCCMDGSGGDEAGVVASPSRGQVLVLEKHAYFLWDFRVDTIHPSTLRT